MAKAQAWDSKWHGELIEHANYLRSAYGARNTLYDAMERMFLLQWDERERVQRTADNVKITLSPSARNTLLGAIRLLTATEPVISVPAVSDEVGAATASDELEKFTAAMWNAAGRVRGDPVHYDLVRSCMLFGEYHVAITSTADLVEMSKGRSKAEQARAEAVAERTPFLFEVWDPRCGYPEVDALGLRSFFREAVMTWGEVLAKYGDLAKAVEKGRSAYEQVTLCCWWDTERAAVWVRGDEAPILQEALNLPALPVVAGLVEGGRLFSKVENQAQPFLYTIYQSGLWQRENLALTALYTNVFAVMANAMFLEEPPATGGRAETDWSVPGGRVVVPPGGRFAPLNLGVSSGLREGLQVAQNLTQESTMYAQALGAPVNGPANYSMTALLAQGGRLPLTTAQRKASWAIGDVLRTALVMLRERSGTVRAKYEGPGAEIEAGNIPAGVEVRASLDVALPQDKLQAANIGRMLVEAGLVSQRWSRENVLNIPAAADMTREIWGERAAEAMYMQYVKDQLAALAQQAQQQNLIPSSFPGREGGPDGAGLTGMPGGMANGAGGPGMGGPMAPDGMAGGLPPADLGQMMGGGGNGSEY